MYGPFPSDRRAKIYVGRLLIECGVKRQEDLVGLTDNFEDSTNYQKAVRFANPQLKAVLEGYADTVKSNNVKAVYNQAVDKMNNGVSVEDFVASKQLFDTIPNYADAKQLSVLCVEKANTAKKEVVYQKALKLMNSNASNKIAVLQKAMVSNVVTLQLIPARIFLQRKLRKKKKTSILLKNYKLCLRE